MVELQKTLSFDEDILPHILRERQKHSGRLAEEGYGRYSFFSQQPPKQTSSSLLTLTFFLAEYFLNCL